MPTGWDTYDDTAAAYRLVRPTYPTEVVQAIEEYTGGRDRVREVLEIGAGTGQATRQLAHRGWNVLALEPGPELAAAARRDLAACPNVAIRVCTFEDAHLEESAYDLVAAATSWHWVDPIVGYDEAARILRPRGAIALWWNAHVPDTTDPRWTPIRRVYEREAPHLARLAPLTPDRAEYDPVDELKASRRFRAIERHVTPFSVDYTVAEFLALIDTYASHRTLSPDQRRRLHEGLEETIAFELGGTITKPYEAVLVLGRRSDVLDEMNR
jgi:SAM-dependent methyltransferase